MVSSFSYICTQFASLLEFPCQQIQVQEVSSYLQTTDTPQYNNNTNSSVLSPRHLINTSPACKINLSSSIKLFLTGCEHSEPGAVIASCWGIKQLHQSGDISSQDAIAQLYSKLPSALHPAPIVNLISELLLSQDPVCIQYNLHTDQHPLALAFFCSNTCADAVLSALFTSLTKYKHAHTLNLLWPCLVQILIDPHAVNFRQRVVTSLLEIALTHISIPEASQTIIPLLQLILQSLIYEIAPSQNNSEPNNSTTNCNNRVPITCIVLDFLIYNKLAEVIQNSFLKDFSLFCLNFILKTDSSTECFLILQKFSRLLMIYPDILLLNQETIISIGLLLLQNNLLTYVDNLLEIVQLILTHCTLHSESHYSVTRVLLTLVFPVLSIELNFSRLNPQTSSQCHSIISSIMSLTITNKSIHSKRDYRNLKLSVHSIEFALFDYDITLYTNICISLLLCDVKQIKLWIDATLEQIFKNNDDNNKNNSNNSSSNSMNLSIGYVYMLIIICSALLVELTQFPTIEDILDVVFSIIHLIQQLIVHYSAAQSILPQLISLFLLILNTCSHPDVLCSIIHVIPKLPSHYSCIVVVLRCLLTLYEIPSLQPTLLRSLSVLWQKHNSIYPKLHALLQTANTDTCTNSTEWLIARGLTILDIAKTRPELHKDDLIVFITRLLESSTSDTSTFNRCIAVECITCIVEAEAMDTEAAVDLLFRHVTYKQFSEWNTDFAKSTIKLLSLTCKNSLNIDAATPCEINFLTKCVQYLLSFLTHQIEDVHSAVYNALTHISRVTFLSLSLFTPDRRRQFSIPISTASDESTDSQYFMNFIDYLLKQSYSEDSTIKSVFKLIETWLYEELTNSPLTITNHALKYEANVIESAIKYVWKYILHPVPKLRHTPESISTLTPIPHCNAIAMLYQGNALWGEISNKLSTIEVVRHYLVFISNSLTLTYNEFSIPSILVLLTLIDAVTKFMSHVLTVFISEVHNTGVNSKRRVISPIESLFKTLHIITSANNCEGIMWLHVGLILSIQEVGSTSVQNCLHDVINTLYINAYPYDESDTTSSVTDGTYNTPLSQYHTKLQTTSPIALSVLCGMMGAHLKIDYSKSVIGRITRAWHSSRVAQKHDTTMDLCYCLMMRAVSLAYNKYTLIPTSPSASKIATLYNNCLYNIQTIGYPDNYYGLFFSALPDNETKLLKDKNAELIDYLKALLVPPSDSVIFNSSVISCRLYKQCELNITECDQLIHLLLNLAHENKSRLACQFSLCLLLNHTSSLGHASSHLLLTKTFKQFQAQLQTKQNPLIAEASLYGIAAILGAGQLIISHNMPVSNVIWTIMSPSLRLIIQTIDSNKAEIKYNPDIIPLLGNLCSDFQLFIETVHMPFIGRLIPPNSMITPIIRLLDEAIVTGIATDIYQSKMSCGIKMLSQMPNKKLIFNWTDIIVLYLKNSPNMEVQESIFKLIFHFYSLSGPQGREQIKMIFDYWLMSPRLRLNIRDSTKLLIVQNILTLFYIYTDINQIEQLIVSFMNTPGISNSIVNGLKCLLEDQSTTSILMAKINFANRILKLVLSIDPLLSICSIEQYLHCMSLLTDAHKSELIPNTATEQCILLRIELFIQSDDVFWLHPVISHLLNLPAIILIASSDFNSQYISIFTQLLRVRDTSAKIISDICLEVLILSKNRINEIGKQTPTGSDPALSTLTSRIAIASNAMFILSIVSPDISCMSSILPNTIYYQAMQNNDEYTTFCLSYMRHILSSTNFNAHCSKKQTPVLKRLYDFLNGVLQNKECVFSIHSQQDSVHAGNNILLSSLYNYFVHFRLIHDVIATKPWAVFAQIVFSQSKHVLL